MSARCVVSAGVQIAEGMTRDEARCLLAVVFDGYEQIDEKLLGPGAEAAAAVVVGEEAIKEL